MKVLGLILLVSCAGQSSDPLKDYKDVKAVAKTDVKSDGQIAPVSPFVIKVVGPNEKNYAHISEGKTGSFDIKVEPQSLQTTKISGSTLKLLDFPYATNKPTIQKKDATTYTVTWTPQVGTIPNGELVDVISFNVLAQPTDAPLQRFGTTHEVTLIVTKTGEVPVILGVDGLPKTVQEGSKPINFTIDIEDPNYNGIRTPKIIFPDIFVNNTEANVAWLRKYVDQNRAQKQNPYNFPGTKRFRYFYTLDVSKLPVDYDREGKLNLNASYVDMCLDVVALSASGTILSEKMQKEVELNSTADRQNCVKAYYTSQPAKMTWLSANKNAVAGKENTFEFKFSTENNLSVIDIPQKEKDAQLKKLSGEKSLECASADKNEVHCILKWTPTSVCGTKKKFPDAKKVVLNLTTLSTLGETKKTFVQDIQFELSDLESNCAEAVAAKEAAQAVEKAKQEAAQAAEQAKAQPSEAAATTSGKAQAAAPQASQKSKKSKPSARTAKPEIKK